LFDVWGCPVVLSCHGAQLQVRPHTPGGAALGEEIRELFGRVAAVHCVSEATRREALAYGLAPGKAWLIRPAVDSRYFRPAPARAADGVFRVVSVGTLRWVKGYEYGLLALALLTADGAPVILDMVGGDPATEPSEETRLRSTIADLGLGEHVRLHGPLPPAGVRTLLQEADAFLQ